MKHFVLNILFILLMTGLPLKAQTVALPDDNLTSKLKADYPSVMQGDLLDISEANNLTGNLILSNASISDATGIDYFTSVHTIDLGGNQLSTLPDISSLTELKNLYVPNNALTSLPEFSTLSGLEELQVHNNQLTALPNLSGATNLRQLYCNNNQLTSFQPFSNLPNLEVLVMGSNPIEGQINFSSLPHNLKELHVHQIGIKDSINGLSSFEELTVLFAWGNDISDFSALDSLTTLNTCVISGNQLEELPYLENKPALNYVDITNNYLSFEDIIPLTQAISPTFFFYTNQLVKELPSVTARELEDITIQSSVPAYPNNIYVWKKEGAVLDSSMNDSYTFHSLAYSDSGSYTLTVYNPNQSDLILTTPIFHVSVNACLSFSVDVAIEEKDCKDYYTIDLSGSNIGGGVAPYYYELVSTGFEKEFDTPYMENIPAGKHTITLTDAQGCSAIDQFTLARIEGCDPVFSPNGDGIADTYFIEEQGAVKVFDAGRNLVTELQAPAEWDGNSSEGSPVDAGYYILVVDEEKVIYLTLIR